MTVILTDRKHETHVRDASEAQPGVYADPGLKAGQGRSDDELDDMVSTFGYVLGAVLVSISAGGLIWLAVLIGGCL